MNICVFGASGDELDREYFLAAGALGALMAREGHCLIFGGGAGGLMGECARGAHDGGGEIIGVAPRFFDEPGILYGDCSRFIYTETMAQRKQTMEDMAEAFVVLPGGIGTFEEFFEVLTLKQLGRHEKPMALLNTLGYYDALLALLENAVEGGFLSRGCLELFSLCDAPRQALDRCAVKEERRGGVKRLRDYHS